MLSSPDNSCKKLTSPDRNCWVIKMYTLNSQDCALRANLFLFTVICGTTLPALCLALFHGLTALTQKKCSHDAAPPLTECVGFPVLASSSLPPLHIPYCSTVSPKPAFAFILTALRWSYCSIREARRVLKNASFISSEEPCKIPQ